MDKVFWKKVILSFCRGFGAALIVTLTGALASPEFKFDKAVVISSLVGAISAGIRAVQAYFTNLEPGDEVHGPTKTAP